jgi:hypothetical protein
VIAELGFEVETVLCWLAVHFVAQRSPVYMCVCVCVCVCVQKWEVSFTFGFHSELTGGWRLAGVRNSLVCQERVAT